MLALEITYQRSMTYLSVLPEGAFWSLTSCLPTTNQWMINHFFYKLKKEKTEVHWGGPKAKSPANLGHENEVEVTSLGVILDSDLKFESHIKQGDQNSILPPKKHCQSTPVQNSAARLTKLKQGREREHITPFAAALHRLPVSVRSDLKVLLLIHKALNTSASSYITITSTGRLMSLHGPSGPLLQVC